MQIQNFYYFTQTVFLVILFTFKIKSITLAKYEKACPVMPFLLFLHGRTNCGSRNTSVVWALATLWSIRMQYTSGWVARKLQLPHPFLEQKKYFSYKILDEREGVDKKQQKMTLEKGHAAWKWYPSCKFMYVLFSLIHIKEHISVFGITLYYNCTNIINRRIL